MTHATLKGAKRVNARLNWADLNRANADGADFSHVNLDDVRLVGIQGTMRGR